MNLGVDVVILESLEMSREQTRRSGMRKTRSVPSRESVPTAVDSVGNAGDVRTESGEVEQNTLSAPAVVEVSQIVQGSLGENETQVLASNVDVAKRKITFGTGNETGNGIPQAESTPNPRSSRSVLYLSSVQEEASMSLTRRPLWGQDTEVDQTLTQTQVDDKEDTDSGPAVSTTPDWMPLSFCEFFGIALFAAIFIVLIVFAVTYKE